MKQKQTLFLYKNKALFYTQRRGFFCQIVCLLIICSLTISAAQKTIRITCGQRPSKDLSGWECDSTYLENKADCFVVDNQVLLDRGLDDRRLSKKYRFSRRPNDPFASLLYTFKSLQPHEYVIRVHILCFREHNSIPNIFIQDTLVLKDLLALDSESQSKPYVFQFITSVTDSRGLHMRIQNTSEFCGNICAIEIIPLDVLPSKNREGTDTLKNRPLNGRWNKRADLTVVLHERGTKNAFKGSVVFCTNKKSNLIYTSISDSSGHTTFYHLPFSTYSISAFAESYEPSIKNIHLFKTGSQSCSLQLQPGAYFYGKVIASETDSTPIQHVTIHYATSSKQSYTTCDSSGFFYLAGLQRNGMIRLRAFKNGYTQKTNTGVLVTLGQRYQKKESYYRLYLVPRSKLSFVINTPHAINGKTGRIKLTSNSFLFQPFYAQFTEIINNCRIVNLPIDPGTYTLGFSIDGFQPFSDTLIRCNSGVENVVTYTLKKQQHIVGQVINAENQPLPGTLVFCILSKEKHAIEYALQNSAQELGSFDTTDALGRFKVFAERDQHYSLIFSHDSYQRKTTDIFVQGDIDTIVQSLVAGGKICGRVIDKNNEPIKSVYCNLHLRSEKSRLYRSFFQKTDSNGVFCFSQLDTGVYALYVESEKYLLDSLIFSVNELEVLPEAEIILDEGYQISGKVIGYKLSDSPLTVCAYADLLQFGPGTEKCALVDASGNFKLSGLSKCTYHLYIPRNSSEESLPPVKVQSPSSNVIISLPDKNSFCITGRVFDYRGKALELYNAGLYGCQPTQFFESNFTLYTSKNGIHKIIIRAPNHAQYTSEQFILNKDHPSIDLPIQLSRGLSWSGKIVSASGQPIQGCIITDYHTFRVFTDTAGVFTLTNLINKSYDLEIEHKKYLRARVSIEPFKESNTIATFQLMQGGSVEGFLFQSTGKPVSNESINCTFQLLGESLLSSYDNVGTCLTNDSGYFKMSGLQAGKRRLHIPRLNYSHYIEILEGKTTRVNVHLPLQPEPITPEDNSTGKAFVLGLVTLNGKPVLEGQLLLSQFDYNFQGTKSCTIGKGSFHFSDVLPGTYSCYLKTNRSVIRCPQTYTVIANDTNNIQIQLSGAIIQGRVIDTNSLPISEVTVDILTNSTQDRIGTCTTSLAGEFNFKGIDTGNYFIKCLKLYDEQSPVTKLISVTDTKSYLDVGDFIFTQGYQIYGKILTADKFLVKGNALFIDVFTGETIDFAAVVDGNYSSNYLRSYECLFLLTVDGYYLYHKKIKTTSTEQMNVSPERCPPFLIKVVGENGDPLPDAHIFLKIDKKELGLNHDISRIASFYGSNESGVITVKSYYKGTQTFTVISPRYTSKSISITLPHNTKDPMTVILSKEP